MNAIGIVRDHAYMVHVNLLDYIKFSSNDVELRIFRVSKSRCYMAREDMKTFS